MNTYTKEITGWEKIMMAITFAEAGEAGTARQMLNRKQQQPELRNEPERRPELRV